MKNKYPNCPNWLVMGLLASLAVGCATPALRQATEKREWRPCSVEQIFVLTHTNQQRQFVVLFTQSRKGDRTNIITRAVGWSSDLAPGRVVTSPAAIRRLTNQVGVTVQSLPILLPMEVMTNAAGRPASYAIIGYPPTYFWSHLDGEPARPHSLPATTETFNTARVCLYPMAVAADCATVGAVAVVIVGGTVATIANSGTMQVYRR